MTSYDFELSAALNADKTVLTAWSAIPDTGLVRLLSDCDFGAVTLDMQHGGHGEASVWDGLAATIAARTPSLVRIPVGRFDMASRALDFGADAIIAPMINSVADAKAFASFSKYPPLGTRSWGVTRLTNLRGIAGGNAYLHRANTCTMTFAMIETRAALDALDDILDVDGIDAVFVGPADFSIAWTGGEAMEPDLPDMMGAIADIAARARDKDKHAGIFAMDPALVPRYAQMGYRLIAVGLDGAIVKAGAKTVLDVASNA